jgi:hypothetical protein
MLPFTPNFFEIIVEKFQELYYQYTVSKMRKKSFEKYRDGKDAQRNQFSKKESKFRLYLSQFYNFSRGSK